MPITVLRASQRALLRARAHDLSPVVMIGDAGLTDNVMAEIGRALNAHELIKIRVAGDDRSQRLTLLETICVATGAAPVQQIGKLLILYRPAPQPEAAPIPTKKRAPKAPVKLEGRRNPVSGRAMAQRATKKDAAVASRPPRTERVRKAGQKSAKKAFQGQ